MRLTNEQKSEVVAGFLGFGNANAKSRIQLMAETGLSDRDVRRGIQSLRREYPVVKSDTGYFIADPTDPTDRELAAVYYAQEYQRMYDSWSANFSNAQQNAVIMTIASNEPGIFFEILGVKTIIKIEAKPIPKAHQLI